MTLTHSLGTACFLALGLAIACDVEKDDTDPRQRAADTGPAEDDEGEEEGEASSSAGEGDDHDCEDDDAEMTSDTGEVPPPPGEPYAFAMRYGDLPEVNVGESDSGGGSDGEPFQDDDALVVTIANAAQSCEDPYAALPCGGNFSIGFILPPDIQAPGTYQLWEEAFGSQTYAAPPYPEGDCAWGGGSLDGLVEIEVIDDTHVVGRLLQTDAWDFDADLEFDAALCG
jgi:hypothetical protein